MSKKLLIVDDDADLLRAMSIRFKAGGYETVLAMDGISAISTAQKEKPDAILLDLGLPGGDGFTVMERLQGLPGLAGTPIIVVSAQDPLNNMDKAYKAGATAFFQKPFNNALLLSIVGRTCSKEEAKAPKKILVVDDDEDQRRGMAIRLRASNYEPVFAQDAVSAISTAQKERPDLIILDLGLPCGDGLLVLVRLRSNPTLADIPVIVLTGQDASQCKEKVMRGGAQAFFQKPADTLAFKEAIRRALEGQVA